MRATMALDDAHLQTDRTAGATYDAAGAPSLLGEDALRLVGALALVHLLRAARLSQLRRWLMAAPLYLLRTVATAGDCAQAARSPLACARSQNFYCRKLSGRRLAALEPPCASACLTA